jgi:SAM-dependent methyltransferase
VLRRKDVLRFYRQAPRGTRLYLRVKLRICPLLRLEELYPKAGKVVDLGCGNGTFSNILKLGGPEREILGVDLDPRKVEAAGSMPCRGARVRGGRYRAMDYPPADVYSLVDVLYLIPFDRQDEILRGATRPAAGRDARRQGDGYPAPLEMPGTARDPGRRSSASRSAVACFGAPEIVGRSKAGFKADVVRLDRGRPTPIAIRGLKGK